jgi:hypothetical protein
MLSYLEYEDLLRFLGEVGSSTTAFPTHFETPVLDPLRRARINRTLTIVLGAGVSVPFKVQDWDAISLTLLRHVFPKIDPADLKALVGSSQIGSPVLIRFLEGQSRMKALVRVKLREALYATYLPSPPIESLSSIIRLLDNRRSRSSVRKVITYNFDSVLEMQIETHAPHLKFDIIYSDQTLSSSARLLKIFHPHGYLPQYEYAPSADCLATEYIFSERDYHARYENNNHWANVAQIDAFSSTTCLFIGISFRDPNIRRVLDFSYQQSKRLGRGTMTHYAIMRLSGTPLNNLLIDQDLRSFGVLPIWVDDYRETVNILSSI